MRRFVSFNLKSIITYTFVIAFVVGIEVLSIIDRNPMAFILPIVGAWMLFAFFMSLFSRCKFTEEGIKISGDFLIDQNSKIQKKHYIKYSDVAYYRNEKLPSGLDSNHNEIRMNDRTRQQYLSFYNYKYIRCLTFYLKDGRKQCLILNRYSENQVNHMYRILKERVHRTYVEDIEFTKTTSYDEDNVNVERIKFPTVIIIFFVLYFITFIAFAIHSGMIGGDALNGYKTATEYVVSSHGRDTVVTAEEWNLNYTLGISMGISSALLFPSAAFFFIRRWFKNRQDK